jgi:hypothetical protein
MPPVSALSLRIPVRCATLIGLDLSLAMLISIIEKRKQLLTCTQEITRVKFERLRLARLTYSDQKTTTRHAMTLSKAKGLISLVAPIKHL